MTLATATAWWRATIGIAAIRGRAAASSTTSVSTRTNARRPRSTRVNARS
jgi:hypothetical protein